MTSKPNMFPAHALLVKTRVTAGPPLPVLKKPLSDKDSPLALFPVTLQKMVLLGGNAGVGVQVNTVWSALQEYDVARNVNGEGSRNCTEVMPALVFIASLKVNITGADGKTPVAAYSGSVDTING